MVTVTKGERKSAEGTRGKSVTENVDRQRRKSVRGIERTVASRDRERVRGKEREGMIFAREGCAVRRAAAQNHPLRPAPLRAFSSLFLALLAVLFFFPAGPPSRRARCFSSPWTASIFLFERLRSHAPAPQWPRARKFVAGAAPFPATPASFSPIPLAPQPPFSRTTVPSSPPPLPRSSTLLCSFFSPFFCPGHPSASTCRRRRRRSGRPPSPSLACSPHSSASPPGVYFKRSLEPTPAPSRGATVRYVRSVLYTILEARNVCARLWPGVYTAAV